MRVARQTGMMLFLHHVDATMLETVFYAPKRAAVPGVDGMTWRAYEQDLNLVLPHFLLQ
ncbi:hypothetical protein OGR47_19050 (plasmid) [Methylocystis sp. MJC1]|uniref:hypothetical protein n=1 Tax=Methylocystis sp. MJC1 TaxID=2654282 RepID=UPI0013EDF7DF|nr:hypothetical protein [Methylocystis sp. MJC1]MBU6529048.1 hypothetical protein [Methylocystis sp. MJC1]UZX13987.1 hypothetical protein OGR47_19050 [Methylocystis sp. MJC1]